LCFHCNIINTMHQINPAPLITLIFLFLAFSSCRKEHHVHGPDPAPVPLNIDYPAVYIVNGGSGNISVVEIVSGKVKDFITLGGAKFPHHISLSPDQKLLAVAITSKDLSGGHGGHGGTGDFKIMILDAVTGLTVKNIIVDRMPHNGAFSPDGKELWVGQADSVAGTVLVFNTFGWALKNTINVGKSPSEVTFSHDGSLVCAANTGDGTVSLINPSTKQVISTLITGATPVGAWPGTNGYMYADNETDETVSEISVPLKSVVSTIFLGFKPGYVAFSVLNNELWVSNSTYGKIVYFEKSLGNWVRTGSFVTGADAHAIAFSADGKTAYITNQGAHTLSVVDVASHTVLNTITMGLSPNGLVIRE
jgi:YVTN family beta-propeller protein